MFRIVMQRWSYVYLGMEVLHAEITDASSSHVYYTRHIIRLLHVTRSLYGDGWESLVYCLGRKEVGMRLVFTQKMMLALPKISQLEKTPVCLHAKCLGNPTLTWFRCTSTK